MSRVASDVPADMRRVSRRLEKWRASHAGRLPIPKRLWASAVEVARRYGVGRTAQILRLEYGKLKRLADSGSSARDTTRPSAFVELVGPQAMGSAECLIELEGPHGKMRIQWKGSSVPDLAGLSRGLWESA